MADGNVTRVDLHVKVLDTSVVRRAKKAGLDVLVYAPHFTHLSDIRDEAERYTDDELVVVPARECFTGRWNRRRHVLVVDPSEPIPDFLPFEQTMTELDRRDETVLAPHPEFLTMSVAREDIHEYRNVFDAVEVFCPKNTRYHTRRMHEVATETGLSTYVSSYAHLPHTVGEVWVEYDVPIETAEDLRAALTGERECRHRRKDGLTHLLKRCGEIAHLGYENTWERLRRMALQPCEPTNHRNPRYDDRYNRRGTH